MASDLERLKGLRGAVAAAPEDLDLRLELIHLLLELQRPQDAWHHCIRILNETPDHIETLRLARDAAQTVGAVERAQEYEDQLSALRAGPTTAAGHQSDAKTFHVRGRTLRLIRGSGGQKEESK